MKVWLVLDNGDTPDTAAVFSTRDKAVQYIESSVKHMADYLGDKVVSIEWADDNCVFLEEEDGLWPHSWFILERDLL